MHYPIFFGLRVGMREDTARIARSGRSITPIHRDRVTGDYPIIRRGVCKRYRAAANILCT